MNRTDSFYTGKYRKLGQKFVVKGNFARVRITLIGNSDIEGDGALCVKTWPDPQYVDHGSNQKS